jgi:hypothetical protein
MLLLMIGFLLPFFFFKFDTITKNSELISAINTIASIAAVFVAVHIARTAQARDSALLSSSYDYDLYKGEYCLKGAISLKIRVSNAGLRPVQIKSVIVHLKDSMFKNGVYEEDIPAETIVNPGCFINYNLNPGSNVKLSPENLKKVCVVDAFGKQTVSYPTGIYTANYQESYKKVT